MLDDVQEAGAHAVMWEVPDLIVAMPYPTEIALPVTEGYRSALKGIAGVVPYGLG